MSTPCTHGGSLLSCSALEDFLTSATFQAKLKNAELACGRCDYSLPHLWLCLENGCFFIGCGRSQNAHSLRHATQTSSSPDHHFGHCVCVNMRTAVVWCYECDDELKLPEDDDGDSVHTLLKKYTSKKTSTVLSLKSDRPLTSGTAGLKGFPNYGNTCYANATLQVLINAAPFRRFFEQICTRQSRKGSLSRTPRSVLVDAFSDLVRAQWTPSAPRESVDRPLREVISCIGQVNPTFRGYQQQDSQEFLRCLLDSIHEELRVEVIHPTALELARRSDLALTQHSNDSGGEEDDSSSDCDDCAPRAVWDSIVSRAFGGKLLSEVMCSNCGEVSRTTDPFFDLSVSIPSKKQRAAVESNEMPPANTTSGGGWFGLGHWFSRKKGATLESCLTLFTAEEELTGKEQYRCGRCKGTHDASKRLLVASAPEVLCIHLKRFRYDSFFGSKVSTHVTFPEAGLDLAPYMSPGLLGNDMNSTLYDLIGVVNHHGHMGGGHYTSYARNVGQDAWFQYDDQRVSPANADDALNSQAYVLFYVKRPTPAIIAAQRSIKLMLKEAQLASTSKSTGMMLRYISRKWLYYALQHASPGHITNTDLTCIHNVASLKHVPGLKAEAVVVPADLYSFAYRMFGGGPEVSDLYETCDECDRTIEDLEKRAEQERREVSAVDSSEIPEGEVWYVINAKWLKSWREFVIGETLEVPGPVNNKPLIRKKTGDVREGLKSHRDYKFVNRNVWNLFMKYYQGGPEIIRKELKLYPDDE